MEVLKLIALAAVAWCFWYFIKSRPSQKKTPGNSVQKEVEALRRMAGDDSTDPYIPPTSPTPRASRPARASVKSGLKRLRDLCREARLDEQITEGEARRLLQAFDEFEHEHPGKNAIVGYVLDLLKDSLSDGRLDAREAQELLTAVGEFADEELPSVLPVAPTPTTKSARTKKAKKPVRNVSLRSGQEYLLNYTDASGNESERVIRLTGISSNGDTQYIEGFCNKAKAPRTFRLDRVQSLVDLSTGEIMINA